MENLLEALLRYEACVLNIEVMEREPKVLHC